MSGMANQTVSVRRLETYEWDNLWFEHTEITKNPRVLIIGDSISCGYRRIVNEMLEGRVQADGLGTSKAADNPHFRDALRYVFSQQSRCDAILINNGLHGWHLSDDGEYRTEYARLIAFLRSEKPEAKLVMMLTTPVADGERNARVDARNRSALEIAREYGLDVIDLNAPLRSRPELLSADGVHLTEAGYRLPAGIIAAAIENMHLRGN